MIDQPLTLPCGRTLANRLCKAAMTEGLADAHDHATPAHQRLYATWARGGAALLLSGNIRVDRRWLERAGNGLFHSPRKRRFSPPAGTMCVISAPWSRSTRTVR